MTTFETASHVEKMPGAADLTFIAGKELRMEGTHMKSAPRDSLTTKELIELQRKFDRFILSLPPPKTRRY